MLEMNFYTLLTAMAKIVLLLLKGTVLKRMNTPTPTRQFIVELYRPSYERGKLKIIKFFRDGRAYIVVISWVLIFCPSGLILNDSTIHNFSFWYHASYLSNAVDVGK